MADEWPIERVLAVGDRATGTDVLGELYRAQRTSRVADLTDARFVDGGPSLPCIGGRADVRVNMTGRVPMFGSTAWQIPATFNTTSADSSNAPISRTVVIREQGNIAINAIHELVRDAGKPVWDWKAPAKDEALIAKIDALGKAKLEAAYQIRSKQARTHACRAAYAEVKAALTEQGQAFDAAKVEGLLFDIEARIVRVLPHLVDTALLGAAVTMLTIARLDPRDAPWLLAKIVALLVYIVLGAIAISAAMLPSLVRTSRVVEAPVVEVVDARPAALPAPTTLTGAPLAAPTHAGLAVARSVKLALSGEFVPDAANVRNIQLRLYVAVPPGRLALHELWVVSSSWPVRRSSSTAAATKKATGTAAST